MRKTNARRPCVLARAAGATAALAGTLVRLSAGIAAIACLGCFVRERMRKGGKREKGSLPPPGQGKGRGR